MTEELERLKARVVALEDEVREAQAAVADLSYAVSRLLEATAESEAAALEAEHVDFQQRRARRRALGMTS